MGVRCRYSTRRSLIAVHEELHPSRSDLPSTGCAYPLAHPSGRGHGLILARRDPKVIMVSASMPVDVSMLTGAADGKRVTKV